MVELVRRGRMFLSGVYVMGDGGRRSSTRRIVRQLDPTSEIRRLTEFSSKTTDDFSLSASLPKMEMCTSLGV